MKSFKHCSNNLIIVRGNGRQHDREKQKGQSLLKAPATRYTDARVIGSSPSTVATITDVLLVSAGTTPSTRVADTGRIREVFLNMSVFLVNADIYTTTRFIMFQWHPSTGIALPIAGDILQDPTQYDSFYSWGWSQNYTILLDTISPSAGISTSITDSSNLTYYGKVPLRGIEGFDPYLQWLAGAQTGTNHIFILFMSNSAIAPFPVLDYATRVVFDCD